MLEEWRPAPLSLERRQQVLAALPRQGDVTELDPRRALKVTAVGQLLAATRRSETHTVKVVDVRPAAVLLLERCVILISLPALDLLSEDELTALVAHELGHEYTWTEWSDARTRADRERLRDIELICDLIAAATLSAFGKPTSTLVSAIDKVRQHNLERFGAAPNDDDYPSVSQRRTAIREFARHLGQR